MKLWIFLILSLIISMDIRAEWKQFGFQDYPQAYMFYYSYDKPIKREDSSFAAQYMLSFVEAQSVPNNGKVLMYLSAIYSFDIDCIHKKFIPSDISYHSFQTAGEPGEEIGRTFHISNPTRNWIPTVKGTRMDYIMKKTCH